MRSAIRGVAATITAGAMALLVACSAPSEIGAGVGSGVGSGVGAGVGAELGAAARSRADSEVRSRAVSAPTEPGAWAADRAEAGTELLRTRVSAIAAGDLGAWLSGVEGTALRAGQQAVFTRMQRLGIGPVTLRALTETVPPVPARAGQGVPWHVRATLEYRLKDFDSSPRSFTLDLTLKADPSAARRTIAVAASRPADRPEPWDIDGMRVQRSGTALVITFEKGPSADEVVHRAASAAQEVDAVLGEVAPAVWVAPPTDADAAALLGRTHGEIQGVAAAVDGPIGPGEPAGADRIVLVPGAWLALNGTGRQVVMTHELTHAVTRRTSTRQPPLWLSEGLADFVAYRDVDRPERELVGAAVRRTRDKGLPADLPTSAEFQASGEGRAQAYALSLLAARTIAERHGVEGLVRLFRAANGSRSVALEALSDGDAVVDRLLEDLLGTTRGAVISAWRDRLAALERAS